MGCGVDEAADRLVSGDDGRQRDHGDDEDAGQVFGAAVAVGVAPGGRSTAEDEGDPQRQAVRASEKLWMVSASSATEPVRMTTTACATRGDEQGDQADLDGADTVGAGLQGGVDRVGGVVAVRAEDRQEQAFHPAGVIVVAAKSAAVSVTVLVAIVGAVARVRVARLVRVGVLVRARVVASCGRVRAVDARRGDVLLRGGRCVMGVAVEAFSGVLMRFVGGAHEPVDSVVVR